MHGLCIIIFIILYIYNPGQSSCGYSSIRNKCRFDISVGALNKYYLKNFYTMQKKSNPSYLRSLKTYRENRIGVLQTSKKSITPVLLTKTRNVNSRQGRRHNSIKNDDDSCKSSDGNFFSNNSNSNTKLNEAVAEYKIQSYALNDRLFVEPLQEDNNNFQSSDRPPLVRYSHLPNTLKYERISVPRGVLDRPGSFDNCMPAENIIEPSLAAAAHCTQGWIAPRAT